MAINVVSEERIVTPAKIYNDPYMRAEIEQIDHNYTQFYSLLSFSRSHSCKTAVWQQGHMVWLDPKSSNPNVDLTKKVKIYVEGWYRIYIRVRRGPTNKGKVRFYINNNLIDEPYEVYYEDYHWKMVDFGLVYLNMGNNSFKLTLDPNIGVGNIFIYKIYKHDSYDITNYSKKLDIKSLEFTQNSVNELNVCTMPITLKEEYYDDDSPSRFIFDGYTNALTIWMGEKRKTSKAMFGGYITGLNDSNKGILTVKAADRLLDFYREPILVNFNINASAAKDDTKLFPYVKKSTVYDAIRYIAENNEEGINCSGLEAPTVFYWHFSSLSQFESLNHHGYSAVWDKKARSPNPCLRLGVGKISGPAYAWLFNNRSDPFDANIDNVFAFDYMYSSKSAKYPTELHFEFDMYKEGETLDNAQTYTVLFNSKEGASNPIGTIKPNYDGKWNTVKFDLRDAFDKYVSSAEYNVTGVRIVDTISSTQIKNRLNSAIWLDNITVYDEIKNVKTTVDQEAMYPYDLCKELCDASEYSMWVDYGDSRREDVLVLCSNYEDVSDIKALPDNTYEIGDVTYDLRDSNVRNRALRMYHPEGEKTKKVQHIVKNKPSKKKYKKIYVKENGKNVQKYEYYTYKKEKIKLNLSKSESVASSYYRYRAWRDFKDLNDITKAKDAENDATTFLNEHNTAPYGFPITLKGTTLLNPNEYLLVSADKRHLSGLHKIKAITHNYTASNKAWKTQIDLGLPSKRFRKMVLNMRRNINRLSNMAKGVTYTNDQLASLGTSGQGIYI